MPHELSNISALFEELSSSLSSDIISVLEYLFGKIYNENELDGE